MYVAAENDHRISALILIGRATKAEQQADILRS